MKARDKSIQTANESDGSGIRPSQLMRNTLQRRICLGAYLAVCLLLNAWPAQSQAIITTFAGNGNMTFPSDGVLATAASLNHPRGLAIDSTGSVYISDTDNWRVRRVSPAGIISSVAGNGSYGAAGDGSMAISASFSDVTGIALDAAGTLYIADASNRRIRKVTPGGIVTTFAGTGIEGSSGDGGLATNATLNRPVSVTIDVAGNLYICDSASHNIRRVSLASGIITRYAGSGLAAFFGDGGQATGASLMFPLGVATDKSGNLYIADAGNNCIRRVSPGGVIATVAGNGNRAGFAGDGAAATVALLNIPSDVAVDGSGSLFIADSGNNRIRKVDGASGIISTIAGTNSNGFSGDGGPALGAMLDFPWGLMTDAAGSFYFADRLNNRVKKIPGTSVPPTSPAMSISKGGIVPVAGISSTIQPGSWVSIYGTNLANGTSVWGGDFPTSLGDVTVTINNKAAYLCYVSPAQINLQAPDGSSSGPVNVTISRSGTTVSATVTLALQSPAFLLLGDAQHATGLIIRNNGSGSQGAGTYDFAGPASMG